MEKEEVLSDLPRMVDKANSSINQTNVGMVSKKTPGKLPEDGLEARRYYLNRTKQTRECILNVERTIWCLVIL